MFDITISCKERLLPVDQQSDNEFPSAGREICTNSQCNASLLESALLSMQALNACTRFV
jgi:hypothetical protein